MHKPGQKVGDQTLVDPVFEDGSGGFWIVRSTTGTHQCLFLPRVRPVDVPVVNHPHVWSFSARIPDGATEGFLYPWANGAALHEILEKGRVERKTVRRWAVQLADALAAAHAAGVVHGALSTRRVWVAGEDVRLWGFGLGRDPLVPDPGGAGAPTAASDRHAFGCLLYELLAGVPPFAGTAEERARLARTAACQPLPVVCPELPEDVGGLVYGLLSPYAVTRPTDFGVLRTGDPWPDSQSAPKAAPEKQVVLFERPPELQPMASPGPGKASPTIVAFASMSEALQAVDGAPRKSPPTIVAFESLSEAWQAVDPEEARPVEDPRQGPPAKEPHRPAPTIVVPEEADGSRAKTKPPLPVGKQLIRIEYVPPRSAAVTEPMIVLPEEPADFPPRWLRILAVVTTFFAIVLAIGVLVLWS